MINLIISGLFIFLVGFVIKSIMSKPTPTASDKTSTQNETSSKQDQPRNSPTEFIPAFFLEGSPTFHRMFLINGEKVDMTISTATRINVISEQIWKQLGKPKLNNINMDAKSIGTYPTTVQSHGFFNADIKDPELGLSTKAKFYVIDTIMGMNIIGGETFQTLAAVASANPFIYPGMNNWGAEQNSESWD